MWMKIEKNKEIQQQHQGFNLQFEDSNLIKNDS